jgi:hypothetical protein
MLVALALLATGIWPERLAGWIRRFFVSAQEPPTAVWNRASRTAGSPQAEAAQSAGSTDDALAGQSRRYPQRHATQRFGTDASERREASPMNTSLEAFDPGCGALDLFALGKGANDAGFLSCSFQWLDDARGADDWEPPDVHSLLGKRQHLVPVFRLGSPLNRLSVPGSLVSRRRARGLSALSAGSRASTVGCRGTAL